MASSDQQWWEGRPFGGVSDKRGWIMKLLGLAALAAFVFFATPSQAQLGQAHFKAWDAFERGAVATVRVSAPQSKKYAQRRKVKKTIQARLSPAIARPTQNPVIEVARTVTSLTSQILPHPAGCPRRLFCGCGAAVEVFGRPIRHLYLAANWLKFPAAQPGPGMVAARRGHVMVIRQYLGNNRALVYDANSGGGKTRLHVRSLAGFSVRNPRA